MTRPGGALAALKCVLELRLDLARWMLGSKQRTFEEKRGVLEGALQAGRDGAQAGTALLQQGWDAATHRGLLEHLTVLEERRCRSEAACADAEAALVRQTQHTLGLDRQLAVLQRLEQGRERARSAAAQRAGAREADLQWLLHAAVRSASTRRDRDAP